MNRVFQSETGERNLILIPDEKLEKMYSLDGYYYKNHDYDPEEYDEEYTETHEYIPFDSSDVLADFQNTEKYELIDGQFEVKEDFELDEPIGLYEEEWTPNGAKYHYYTADWYTGWEDVTDEYAEIMSDLTLVATRKGAYGENEYYVNKDRYFSKHISYMQGAGRDTYTEMDEDEFLHSVLRLGLDKEHYENFPSIAGMSNPVQVVQYREDGSFFDVNYYDLAECEDVGRTVLKDGHNDFYVSPDDREFVNRVSYWAGSLDAWEFSNEGQ